MNSFHKKEVIASQKSPQRFKIKLGWLILGFALLTLIGILNHAMWRDEVNGWLIARDSFSLTEFFQNIKYEGHPLVWYICLWILNQLTPNPLAMQIFHWIIAVITFSLFIIFSPFNRRQKALFIFGYLPLYEYTLISRNYAIGIFSIFLFCTCFSSRHKSYIPLALILMLMANTNAYCLLIAIALGIMLGVEYLFKDYFNYQTQANITNIIIAVCLFSLGVVISVFMLLPPTDSTLQGGADQWILQFDFYRLTQTITRIWRSYILVIIPSDSKPLDLFIFSIFSLGLWGFVITILIKKPLALLFYLMGSLEILLFTYVKFLGSQRHYGHLYIVLITSLWLSYYYADFNLIINYLNRLPLSRRVKKLSLSWFSFVDKYKKQFIMIILWLQLIAGIVAFSRDLITPYSTSKITANFIQANQLDNNIMMGSEDFAVSPISGYLNQKIYYPETQAFGSYVLFTKDRKTVTESEILQQAKNLMLQNQSDVLLILNHELSASSQTSELTISFLKKFTKGFIYNEKYYLYLIKPKNN